MLSCCSVASAGFFDATHVPARGADAVAALGSGTVNTVAYPDDQVDWDRTATVVDTWLWRSTSNIGLANAGWHETDAGHFAGDPADSDAPMLVTTITGLQPGEMYNIYVDYLTDARTTSSGIVNWTLLAGFDPGSMTAFGYVDGATMGSYTTVGLGDPRVAKISDEIQAIDNYRAILGQQVANGAGEISVYIDDTDNKPADGVTGGTNGRAAYDGLAYELLGAPTLTIDRETGSMIYTSDTPRTIVGYSIRSAAGTLDQSQWISIADTYDATAPAPDGGLIDSDDSWTKLTAAGVSTDLSEAELNLSGPQNGGVLPAGVPIDFGTAWTQYFVEDVSMQILLDDDTIENVSVNFEGNGDLSFVEGDITFDGEVNYADIDKFFDNMYTAVSGSVAQAYGVGDFDGDIDVDYDDLVLYREIYDAANGAGAFVAAMSGTGVPEPSTMAMVLLAGAVSVAGRLRRYCGAMLALGCAWALMSHSQAQTTYIDITPTPGGNTLLYSGGSFMAAGEAADDMWDLRAFANGGTAYQSNRLGPEDAPLLSTTINGLQQDFDYYVYGYYWVNNAGNWHAKMSIDPADIDNNGTPGDLTDDFLIDDPSVLFSDNGAGPGMPESTVGPLADSRHFANNPIVAQTGSGIFMREAPLGIATTTGGGSLTVYFDDFAGQTDDELRTWIDGVGIEPVLPLTLEVNTDNGMVSLKNNNPLAMALGHYRITSENGRLNTAGWDSLDAQNFDAVDGDDPGEVAGDSSSEGWGSAAGSNANLLSESNFFATSTLPANGGSWPIGQAFLTGQPGDLMIEYEIGGRIRTGVVSYVTGSDLLGDYDNNDVVDQADYVKWKMDFGISGVELDSDGNGDGTVDIADYVVWRNNLGATAPGAVAAIGDVSVPEPMTWLMLLTGMVLATWRRMRSAFTPLAVQSMVVLVAVVCASPVHAVVELERWYRLGDFGDENASEGIEVGSANTGVLDPDSSADSYGEVQFTFIDLFADEGFIPTYTNVNNVGSGRPLAAADGSTWGVRFNGTDDYLYAYPFNRPDEFGQFLEFAAEPSVNYPKNYDGILGRGMQMWAYPDQAGINAGEFQAIVADTIVAGGPAINAAGRWTQINSEQIGIDSDAVSGEAVVGDTWYHVMQHISVNGTEGAPTVVPGSGTAFPFSSVVYVDGMAVSATNGTMNFLYDYTDSPLSPPTPTSTVLAQYDHQLVIGAMELPNADPLGPRLYGNYFDGVVDDLEVYLYGDNASEGGQDWGTFDLFADNQWIANEIATHPLLGGTLMDGDLDRDGDVDIDDINDFVDGWLSTKEFMGENNMVTAGDWETWTWGDMDHDGIVFLNDLRIMHDALIANGFGGFQTSWLSGAPIPEPGTLVLTVAFCGGMGYCRRRVDRRKIHRG